MSLNSTLEAAPEEAASWPHDAEVDRPGIDAVVARAKGIIAGRIRPEPIVPPPEVVEFLRKEMTGRDPAPTPEFLRFFTDRLNLEAIYKGEPVLCHTTADQVQTVLAVGQPEIFAVLDALTDHEQSRVIVLDTLSY